MQIENTLTEKPAHVPEELVVDFDIYHPCTPEEDVNTAWRAHQEAWSRMTDAPLVYSLKNGGHWIAFQGEDLEVLYADNVNLSNKHITIPHWNAKGVRLIPGEADGEDHAAYRQIIMKSLTPNAVKALREPVRQMARDIITPLAPLGQCDFVKDFGYKLPAVLFLTMMGLPLEDGQFLLSRAHAALKGLSTEEKGGAIQDIRSYLGDYIDRRLAEPKDDFVSILAHSSKRGTKVTPEEALDLSVNLLMAGLDTFASMMGFIIKFLAENPDTRATLVKNPNKIEDSLNEFARRFAVASLARVVPTDFSYKGVHLAEGDMLFLPTALHAVDPKFFPNPLHVDIDRKFTGLLSFGKGPHQCPGSFLAKIELGETMREWLQQIPEFEISNPEKVKLNFGSISAVNSLPLKWAVAH